MNKYVDALNLAIENAKRNIPTYELNEVLEKNLRPIGVGLHDYVNKVCTDLFYPSIEKYVFIDDGITEEHEQYNSVWNKMRRSKHRNSIELKVGNKYILDICLARGEMYLVRIQDENHIYPILYFSKCKDSKIGTNIGILKIYSQIDDKDTN